MHLPSRPRPPWASWPKGRKEGGCGGLCSGAQGWGPQCVWGPQALESLALKGAGFSEALWGHTHPFPSPDSGWGFLRGCLLTEPPVPSLARKQRAPWPGGGTSPSPRRPSARPEPGTTGDRPMPGCARSCPSLWDQQRNGTPSSAGGSQAGSNVDRAGSQWRGVGAGGQGLSPSTAYLHPNREKKESGGPRGKEACRDSLGSEARRGTQGSLASRGRPVSLGLQACRGWQLAPKGRRGLRTR